MAQTWLGGVAGAWDSREKQVTTWFAWTRVSVTNKSPNFTPTRFAPSGRSSETAGRVSRRGGQGSSFSAWIWRSTAPAACL